MSGAAVEELLDEAVRAQELQAGDPADQEEHGDERADRVEAARLDRGRARGRRPRRPAAGTTGPRSGPRRPAIRCRRRRRSRHEGRRGERAPADATDVDAAQPRHVAPATDEQQPPSQGRVDEHVPEEDRQRTPYQNTIEMPRNVLVIVQSMRPLLTPLTVFEPLIQSTMPWMIVG